MPIITLIPTVRPIDALDGADSPITHVRTSSTGKDMITREGLEFDSATFVKVDGVVHLHLRSERHGDVHIEGVDKITRLSA